MDPQFDTDAAASSLAPLLHTIIVNSALNLTFQMTLHPGQTPALVVIFGGSDVPQLLARNAELLLALEHVAAKALRLEPQSHDQISFDAGEFKSNREIELRRSAERAVGVVRSTGQPFHFAPMSSRERRLLHLALAPSGMQTASEGEGPLRHIVLHPGRI